MLLPVALGLLASLARWSWALSDGEPGFGHCGHSFYAQTPPRWGDPGGSLQPGCHRSPGGPGFASLRRAGCDTAVYTAFHLEPGWSKPTGGTEAEEEEGATQVESPALLRAEADPSPPDSPLHRWDSKVSSLVQTSALPQCSALGGGLYVVMGAGGPGDACQEEPLWAALCCSAPGGAGGFSLGFIGQEEDQEKQVTVEELEERLGLEQMFVEGCRAGTAADAQTADVAGGEETLAAVDSEDAEAAPGLEEEEEEETIRADDSQEVAVASESGEEEQAGVASESEMDVQGGNTNSSSIVVYVLSTLASIMTAPLRPIVSRVTQLPGQVTYVLQQDLDVLTALPGDTVSVLHLLISDLLSGGMSAVEMAAGVGESFLSGAYYCGSSLTAALVGSCHAGVAGMGTLAGDTAGLVGDTLGGAWGVTRFFGGRLLGQSEGYVGTVATEMGWQAKAVGRGLGRLAWRSGNGVGNVFRLGGGLVAGAVDVLLSMLADEKEARQ